MNDDLIHLNDLIYFFLFSKDKVSSLISMEG